MSFYVWISEDVGNSFIVLNVSQIAIVKEDEEEDRYWIHEIPLANHVWYANT